MWHLIEIRERDMILYSCDCSKEIFKVHARPFRLSECTVKLLPQRLRAKQGGSLYHVHDGLWYDLTGTRFNDLPHYSAFQTFRQSTSIKLPKAMNGMDRILCKMDIILVRRHIYQCNTYIDVDFEAFYMYLPSGHLTLEPH